MENFRIVLVKHPNDDKSYIFRLPKGKMLSAGERILCDTSRGSCQMGICVTDSFDILENQLKEWYGIRPGALKPIVGILHPIMWEYEVERHAED